MRRPGRCPGRRHKDGHLSKTDADRYFLPRPRRVERVSCRVGLNKNSEECRRFARGQVPGGHRDCCAAIPPGAVYRAGVVPIELAGITVLGWSRASRHSTDRRMSRESFRDIDEPPCPRARKTDSATPIFGKSHLSLNAAALLRATSVVIGSFSGRYLEGETAFST